VQQRGECSKEESAAERNVQQKAAKSKKKPSKRGQNGDINHQFMHTPTAPKDRSQPRGVAAVSRAFRFRSGSSSAVGAFDGAPFGLGNWAAGCCFCCLSCFSCRPSGPFAWGRSLGSASVEWHSPAASEPQSRAPRRWANCHEQLAFGLVFGLSFSRPLGSPLARRGGRSNIGAQADRKCSNWAVPLGQRDWF